MTETSETVAAPAAAEPTKASPTEAAPESKPAENGNGEAAAEPQTNGTETAEEAAKEEEKIEEPIKEMRSIVLTGFGGYKGVKTLKKPEPTAAAGEVLIRVRAW